MADNQRILNGEAPSDPSDSENAINELPDNFKDWMENNEERIARAKSQPYFLRDNQRQISGTTTSIEVEKTLTPQEIAKQRHAARTPEQIAEIQNRWAIRQDLRKYTDEQVANFAEVEKELGVKRGLSMSHIEANQDRPNPNFIKDGKYRINCQSCVMTYEMRRRGFDLETLAFSTKLQEKLSYDTTMLWIDPKTGKPPVMLRAGGDLEIKRGTWHLKPKSKKVIAADFEKMTADEGRYHMEFSWKGGRGGHIVTCERLKDGTLRIYDPQTGKLHDLKYYLDNIQTSRGILIKRVDNLIPATGKGTWSHDKPLTQVMKKSGTATPRISIRTTNKSGGITGGKIELSEEVKKRRAEIKIEAKPFTEKTITHESLKGKSIGISNRGIKEWIN
ncbi:MAG: hypothetical protein J5565_01510 [Muribaculaceae bacterium]|nr:hypothetical protein [Muribaculaceae bacterium]